MNAFSDTERWYKGLCLWREARGESRAGKVAILAVLFNRANDPQGRWPKTVLQVILQPKQFSSFNHDDPNASKLPNPADKQDWAAWEDCLMVVDTPLQADPTNGATNYESFSGPIPPSAQRWARPELLTVQIGKLRFYRPA